MTKVWTVPRPYLMTIDGGGRYPLSQEEADRLIESLPVETASPRRVVLAGSTGKVRIVAATLGGGPAFEVER